MTHTASPPAAAGTAGPHRIGSSAVDEAARWLASQDPSPHPVVPALRSRFGLTALEACWAIREAGQQV